MKRLRSLGAVTLAVAGLQGTGCSWIFVAAPPGPADAKAPVECTASPAAPIVDTIGAGLLGLGGIAASLLGCAAFSSAKDSTGFCVGGVAAIGAAVALGFSAGYGYSVTAECREAQARQGQLSCWSGVEASCGSPCTSIGADRRTCVGRAPGD